MGCIDANELARFLDGEAAPEIEDHLDACADCRALVTELARTLDVVVTAQGSEPEDAVEGWELQSGAEMVASGTQVDRYVVLDAIGAGAMGVVYRAYDPELDRDVAIKLVRVLGDHGQGERARGRVLREAQAMARLAHPNVVAVHDASTFGAHVFVAMELVEGADLEAWLAAEPRAWRDIVRVFAAAARGLAAAHTAGVVHRDFKPSNVLVGNDGRVRVTDFGLAVSTDEAGPTQPAGDAQSRLTEAGALIGTPAFMSPEVRDGDAADARSDQYSFGISLREALAGQPIPASLRAVIARAAADDRDTRHANMDALANALDRVLAPRRARSIAAAAVGLAAVAAVGGYVAATRSADAVACAVPDRFVGVWDDARKQAIHAGLLASKHPLAADTWGRVERAFDRFASGWQRDHVAACEATHVRHEQSPALLDARMGCLGAELARFTALAELYASADTAVVARAEPAEDLVERLARCSDPVALRSGFTLPADPALRARAEAATTELARVEVVSLRGKFADAIAGAKRVIDEAKAVGATRLEADATRSLGETQWRGGDIPGAIETLHAAVDAAKRAGAADLEAGALVVLVGVLGYEDGRYAEALAVARLAESAIRATGDEVDYARLIANRAAIHIAKGDYASARADYQQALVRFEKAYGPEDRRVGQTLMNLAMVTAELADAGDAIALYDRALAIEERSLGAHHPEVALTLANRAIAYANVDRYDEAVRDLERAFALRTEVLGPAHHNTIDTLTVIGAVLDDRGDYAGSLARYRAALAAFLPLLREDHPELAAVRSGIGRALVKLGRWSEAIPELERALAIWSTAGVDGERQAMVRFQLARALYETGARPRALELATAALPMVEDADDHAEVEAWLRAKRGTR
jgi:tetratricopeptide (TPR) repeat protein